MSEEHVQFELTDNVATVRLNRPAAMNALTREMMVRLMELAIRCDEDPDIRAVILTGAGESFCAGADVKAFVENAESLGPLTKELTTYIHAAISRFARMDAPLVVAVNGMAAGGGFSLTLIGDLTLAANTARFTMAYTASGLSPDASSTFFLPRLVGLRRAKQLAITNRRLNAAEALDWGLVDELVEAPNLQAEALKVATMLAEGPTESFGSAKRLMLGSFDHGLEAQMELESREIALNARGADVQEGIRAFVEKRPPVFRGRR